MYKPAFYIYAFLMVIYITFPSDAISQDDKPYQAMIEQNTQKDPWTFTATFINNSSQAMSGLTYHFKGLKKSDSGTSNTSQSGKFEAQPGEKVSLATIRYNKINEGKIEFILEILHKQTHIAGDTLEIKP